MATFTFIWGRRILVIIGLIAVWQWGNRALFDGPEPPTRENPLRLTCSEILSESNSLAKLDTAAKQYPNISDFHDYMRRNFLAVSKIKYVDENYYDETASDLLEIGDFMIHYFPRFAPCSSIHKFGRIDFPSRKVIVSSSGTVRGIFSLSR